MLGSKQVKVLSELYGYPYLFTALAYHKTHKNQKIKIKKGSFLWEVYKDQNPFLTVKKSTQCGVSEYLLARSFTRAIQGKNVLYILPTGSLKQQFVKERADRTITYTPYYTKVLAEESSKKASESMSLKHFGKGSVAYVHSGSEGSFVSFPADDIIIDELDLCNQDNLFMAEERQSASTDKSTCKVGNPTIVGTGIDLAFKNSDQKHWFLKCPSCGEWFHPEFMEHVVFKKDDGSYGLIDAKNFKDGKEPRPFHSCGKPFDRFADGEWVYTQKHDISGYHISKMFSTKVTLTETVQRFSLGLANDTVMQRVYNGDFGLAYTADGAKITEEMLNATIEGYRMIDGSTKPCVMGVDVGKVLNVVIRELLPDKRTRLIYAGELHDFEQIDDLMKMYNIVCGVIDLEPEVRLSKRLIARHKRMFACDIMVRIGDAVRGKIISSDRTQMIDALKESILLKESLLPMNAKTIPNYYDQMTASTRVYDEERDMYRWEEGSQADHYMFAEAFCLMARKIFMLHSR